MALKAGTRLGAYQIVGPLGAGGMGEVYRARDARLGRDVAIKVLPAAFATDPDALARFEREMKTLAGLSHPHIVAIYDVGHDGASAYTVTELLEGETLAEVVSRGPVPIAQGDRIRRRRSPARSRPRTTGHRPSRSQAGQRHHHERRPRQGAGFRSGADRRRRRPMARRPLNTSPGLVMGTVGYMAPEQARGLAGRSPRATSSPSAA